MEGYKAIGGQKNLKGTFRLLSKGRLIFEWKHFSRLQIQTTKKKKINSCCNLVAYQLFFFFPKATVDKTAAYSNAGSQATGRRSMRWETI